MKSQIENGTNANDFQVDECPVHGEEVTKEYEHGMIDCTVFVYECGCAMCHNSGSGAKRYFTSYSEARGTARLAVAKAANFA